MNMKVIENRVRQALYKEVGEWSNFEIREMEDGVLVTFDDMWGDNQMWCIFERKVCNNVLVCYWSNKDNQKVNLPVYDRHFVA